MSLARLLGDALQIGLAYQGGPTHAHANHELGNSTFHSLQPRMSYQYYVNFILTPAGATALDTVWSQSKKSRIEDIQPLVRNISMPSFSIETETLNEYNRPRISQTKITRDPIVISMFDVMNGATLKLWQAYYEYYFKDGRTLADQGRDQRNVDASDSNIAILDFDSNFGYSLPTVQNNRYFFEAIEVAVTNGQREHVITIVNPRISAFNHDMMTYEESKLIELKFTLEYEYAFYNTSYEKTTVANLERYKKGSYLGLPTVAISSMINDFLGDINPLANSDNRFVRAAGSFVQRKLTTAASNVVSNTLQNAGTSVLSTLGNVSPSVPSILTNLSDAQPNISYRNFSSGV